MLFVIDCSHDIDIVQPLRLSIPTATFFSDQSDVLSLM